jgi:CheY-like chemotaxis protein/signal transduction histidine kinase/HAMP domain-containing protein
VAVEENKTGQRGGRRRAARTEEEDAHGGGNGAPAIDVAELEDLLRALRAARNGESGVRLASRKSGIAGELARAFNELAETREATTQELVRLAKAVGRDGRITERASGAGLSGTWAATVDAVNGIIEDLARPTTEVARVIDAVAAGDLSQKMALRIEGRPVKGEFLRIGTTVNQMVEQLSSFAEEVNRVAREVGTEGKLGGQARVRGVGGVWKELTDSVNSLAGNLTTQVRNIAQVTTAVANGDLSRKITVDARGEVAQLKDTVNTMVDQLSSFADEVTRVAREVGTEGRLGGQAHVRGVSGTWRDLTESVNRMASNLTDQVRNIAAVTTAVANGDLSKKVTVDVKGEVAELKGTVNTMVDQLRSFADEVTRVAREVGTEGKLGGQARVEGASGTWADLTDNVNELAANLTTQVRAIAEVTTAVAQGDLSQTIDVPVRGEVAQLKSTINTMVSQLSSFASEVTRVAMEVGTGGRLGGQARVEGVSGVWKELTDNVNTLAQTLTTQLRAISEVSTAVTEGDLTRSITVEAAGEVADLKDTINQMIAELRETTLRNAEQEWLNSNLARFSGMLQGQRDLRTVSRLIMSELTPLLGSHHGAFFMLERGDDDEAGDGGELRLIATYGYKERKTVANRFAVGEGLVGQAALEGKTILLSEAPPDYIRIASGLGEAEPASIVVLPVLFEDQVLAVIELASFARFSTVQLALLEQLAETIGVVLSTISATMRTEELLAQSQQLTQELQSQSEELQAQQEELQQTNKELEEQAATLKASEELLQQQQEELQQTNEELEEKAALLEEQNSRIEIKNREIELARAALEEKAEQLALSSRYKSEFLANMSHELRTPLNSLLILAKLLADNREGNLSEKQVEFANTIHTAGSDLLNLINDILDLSKVEAGKMDVHPTELPLEQVRDYAQRTFRPLADERGLEFVVELGEGVPDTVFTDEQRLQQILKNLLSNAFKFTESGTVRLGVDVAPPDLPFASRILTDARSVLAFSVADTGIGIAEEQARLIFEAFQQADGTTSRRYGGTGLGLSISREIAQLLGGEIAVASEPGVGSTFTLFLPDRYAPAGGSAATAAATEAPAAPAAGHDDDATAPPEVPHVDAADLEASPVEDDRAGIEAGDRVVLIVEDDTTFAETVLATARERGFKGVVATRGDTGLALAHEYRPDAIVLDVKLPVIDGLAVLENLKRHPSTRHIPVHVVTAGNGRREALRAGAMAFLEKPVTRERLEEALSELRTFVDRDVRRLLVVEDDEGQREAIAALIGGDEVEIVGAGSSEEALARLEEGTIDCVVLDLKLPGQTGFDLLEQVKRDERFQHVPIIVYTGRDLTRREETRLKRYAEAIIVKDARSPERLLDETSLFLHRVEAQLPEPKRRMLEQLHGTEAIFQGKRVLIVDDDVRNVFALTSVLESHGMEVRFAENGREALEALEADPQVDVVLMDLMMPELDGYEATREIRRRENLRDLPIIALTAKAMKGDREKSIAAGASDYITKPVDTDQLVSLLRVWLYR